MEAIRTFKIAPSRKIVEKMISHARKEYYDLSRKRTWNAADLPRLRELRRMICAYEKVGGERQ